MRKVHLETRYLKITYLAIISIIFLSTPVWGSAEGGGVHNSWLEIDTWKVLNFIILAIAMFFIGKKPVKEFFSSRAKGIEEELKNLEEQKELAQKKLAEYQLKFANLEQEFKKIIEDYVQQGKAARARILSEAESQAVKFEEMAKRNIEQEFKAAYAELRQEIVDKAVVKAETIIKESITSEDQDRLVDDYLEKVLKKVVA